MPSPTIVRVHPRHAKLCNAIEHVPDMPSHVVRKMHSGIRGMHWKKYFPEAELHILKKSGRYLLEDSPEHLNDLIRDFLERNRC